MAEKQISLKAVAPQPWYRPKMPRVFNRSRVILVAESLVGLTEAPPAPSATTFPAVSVRSTEAEKKAREYSFIFFTRTGKISWYLLIFSKSEEP